MKLFFLINGCLLIADRLTKYYFFTTKYGLFQRNSGHFFLLADNSFFIMLSPILLGLLIWFLKKKQPSPPLAIGLSLIIIGGVSNLFDRIVFGYVIDWINLPIFPFSIFNIADIAIIIGLLVIATVSLPKRKQK